MTLTFFSSSYNKSSKFYSLFELSMSFNYQTSSKNKTIPIWKYVFLRSLFLCVVARKVFFALYIRDQNMKFFSVYLKLNCKREMKKERINWKMHAKNHDIMFNWKTNQEMYRWKKTSDNKKKIVRFEFIHHNHPNVYLIYQLKMHKFRLPSLPMVYEMVWIIRGKPLTLKNRRREWFKHTHIHHMNKKLISFQASDYFKRLLFSFSSAISRKIFNFLPTFFFSSHIISCLFWTGL